ncbi:mitochondrial coenzyme A transporter SLC25A42 [Bombus pascuorum]|uniref:mitochondrial coenzyme A transporter SLC25A42 n=1 Tax=Bombus pascuorum TaxID=65598 RepID=UPI002127F723|nr:mitochondrial coenzyme A transporter SLC25A42 [Bombus pascuorum]XP_060822707.1 mitochondrial coenzyme A transporter SLC25A42 [Bombus pascuorum]XP_060822708.1 mitochondrial coenzyme A transporter SLC25A42 [Bombus pascuorum]XP_060822709.1 mitochondrial coenzyme A transporter SLC25A42 [Bombus pascuorum]
MSVLSNSTKQVLQSPSSLSMEKQDVHTTKKQEKKVGSDGISNTQRVWTSLVSGAIAGALAKTTIAPLDRTKINFQISNQPFSAKAAARFLINTRKTEGLLSLWRGNSATMVRIVPYSAVQFTAHEQWKRILGINGSEREKPGLNFLAGSLAGITSQGTTYPLDLMRARMAVTQKAEYKTLRQIFVRIYVEEGILAYYRGFTATLLGVIPYAGCSFFTYDLLRNLLNVHTVAIPGFSTSLICGAIAGMVAQTSSYPLDIVRRRMQTSAIHGPMNSQHYHTITSTVTKIYKEEGIMAFYKGLSMNWVKGPIAVGISFATHDSIRDALRKLIISQNTSSKT